MSAEATLPASEDGERGPSSSESRSRSRSRPSKSGSESEAAPDVEMKGEASWGIDTGGLKAGAVGFRVGNIAPWFVWLAAKRREIVRVTTGVE